MGVDMFLIDVKVCLLFLTIISLGFRPFHVFDNWFILSLFRQRSFSPQSIIIDLTHTNTFWMNAHFMSSLFCDALVAVRFTEQTWGTHSLESPDFMATSHQVLSPWWTCTFILNFHTQNQSLLFVRKRSGIKPRHLL